MKKQNRLIESSANQQGFTLVEFMVASVLGLVVIAGAGALYSYTKRLNDVGMARVATLQDLRSAATMIGQDARSAGVFGCASLGRQNAPDTLNGEIVIDTPLPSTLTGPQLLTNLTDGTNPAAGVRWIEDSTSLTGIWDSSIFTPASGVLLFYYGEGSLAYKSESSNVVTFNAQEGHPNKIVESIFTSGNGGYLVASGCNMLHLEQVAATGSPSTSPTDKTVTINDSLPAAASPTSLSAGVTAMGSYADMILQRYKVVAYVVGNVTGEPAPGLYRFEFGANGDNWSPPQQLAKNVKGMEAEYLFVTDCPSGTITASGAPSGGSGSTLATINDQKYTVKDAKDGNVLLDSVGNQGPSSVRLTLTYDFPAIRGGSVATGGTDQKFVITSTVRGGNVCASRKLMSL